MSTSAPISNLPKITSSNICWSRGFLRRASVLTQSLLVSVRLNKAGKLQKAKQTVRCNRSTPHGAKKKKKKSICADKRSPLHRQSGGARCIRDGQRRKPPVCRWKTNTSCQSNPTSESKWERIRSWPPRKFRRYYSFFSSLISAFLGVCRWTQGRGPLDLNALLWLYFVPLTSRSQTMRANNIMGTVARALHWCHDGNISLWCWN